MIFFFWGEIMNYEIDKIDCSQNLEILFCSFHKIDYFK